MPVSRHIAVIPARKGSKGFPGKNRLLFPFTRDFIRAVDIFDKVILTTDDEVLIDAATAEGWEARQRPSALADDQASIKDVFADLVDHADVRPTDYLWLVFLPLVYKNPDDFRAAKRLMEQHEAPGLCSFMAAASHPFNCWRLTGEGTGVRKFIDNDYYNRQDYPTAWENYNYLCAIRVDELAAANANLVSERSYPYLMSAELAAMQVELDEPEDLERWRQIHPQQYHAWLDSLPAGTVLPQPKTKE